MTQTITESWTPPRRPKGSDGIRWSGTYDCWFAEMITGRKTRASGRTANTVRTRHVKTARTPEGYAAAEAVLAEMQAEHAAEKAARHDPAGFYMLVQAVEDWLDWVIKTPGVGEVTRDKYRGMAGHWIYPYFGSELLRDTGVPELWAFFDRAAPDLGQDALKRLKHILVHAWFHAAKDPARTGCTGPNPATDIKLPKAGREPRDYDFLTLPQVEHALKTALASPDPAVRRMYALLLVGCTLGLRPGELRALKWNHIDFDNRVLYILEYARAAGDGKPKNTTSRRGVEMPELVHDALWELSQGNKAKGYVFTDADGHQYTGELLRRDVCRAFAVAGLENLDPYSMRHTAVSIMYASGMTFKEIYPITGHANEVVLARTYAHRLNPVVTETKKLNQIYGSMGLTGRVKLVQAA